MKDPAAKMVSLGETTFDRFKLGLIAIYTILTIELIIVWDDIQDVYLIKTQAS